MFSQKVFNQLKINGRVLEMSRLSPKHSMSSSMMRNNISSPRFKSTSLHRSPFLDQLQNREVNLQLEVNKKKDELNDLKQKIESLDLIRTKLDQKETELNNFESQIFEKEQNKAQVDIMKKSINEINDETLFFNELFIEFLHISYRTSQSILTIFRPPSPLGPSRRSPHWNSYSVICAEAYCVKLVSTDGLQFKFIRWGLVILPVRSGLPQPGVIGCQ